MAESDNRDEITSFDNYSSILAELWINYKDDKEFQDFIEYNDLGLPLAFLIDSELVTPTEIAKKYVEETWMILLKSLEINEDIGFTCLEDLFDYRDSNK
jgi:hypothetical protein